MDDGAANVRRKLGFSHLLLFYIGFCYVFFCFLLFLPYVSLFLILSDVTNGPFLFYYYFFLTNDFFIFYF